jgi:hypothetical protein
MKSPVMKQLEKLFYRADTKAVPRFTRSGNMTLPPGHRLQKPAFQL